MKKEVSGVKETIDKLKIQSQEFINKISGLKEQDISANFYLSNLKKLSLQSLDLFEAMQRQVNLFNNQKKFLASKKNTLQPVKNTKRRENDLSLD